MAACTICLDKRFKIELLVPPAGASSKVTRCWFQNLQISFKESFQFSAVVPGNEFSRRGRPQCENAELHEALRKRIRFCIARHSRHRCIHWRQSLAIRFSNGLDFACESLQRRRCIVNTEKHAIARCGTLCSSTRWALTTSSNTSYKNHLARHYFFQQPVEAAASGPLLRHECDSCRSFCFAVLDALQQLQESQTSKAVA